MEYNREESYIPEGRTQSSPADGENTARRPAQEVFEWLDAIVAAIVTVVLLFTFVFRVVGVDGTSMLQTLQDKDKVIISNVHYTPAYGGYCRDLPQLP